MFINWKDFDYIKLLHINRTNNFMICVSIKQNPSIRSINMADFFVYSYVYSRISWECCLRLRPVVFRINDKLLTKSIKYSHS